ncbi:hypothetical protein FM037_02480 [Shewanella psychropiezotolerans]|uniref:Uncharacterized protein n=1 Tax=Shewanella psychropiezotolerans TaxID=2593655 RepID=A0ABX5WVX5_9GAMM|nr:hypothetical protein [Shewanella psychropiezotolerans]QDO82312.1 hypothetical protein FM037_02480 [Shewanella psychropiezotolerans]
MDANTIASVSEAMKNVTYFFSNIISGFNDKRGEILEEHIEPLYNQMTLIHKDYMAGFLAAKNCIENDEDPNKELSKFLEGRRLTALAEREASDSFANSLKSLDKVLLLSREKELIKVFGDACINYLKRSSRVGNISWYSEVIRINATYIDIRDNCSLPYKAWEHPENGDNVKARILEHIHSLLNGELGMVFKPVNDAYYSIRQEIR